MGINVVPGLVDEPVPSTAICRHCATLIRWHVAGVGWRHCIAGIELIDGISPVFGEHRAEPLPATRILVRGGDPYEARLLEALDTAPEAAAPGIAGALESLEGYDAPAGAGDDVEAYR